LTTGRHTELQTCLAARQLFIYWRCPAAQAGAAQTAARAMQATLCERHPGLIANLLVRVDGAQTPVDEVTLMETYAQQAPPSDAAAGVSAALQAELEAAAAVLQPWLRGARHVEVFELLA
jgi:hypothetical protein